MNRQRYTLDARAARKVQRAITSTRLPSAARPNEGKNTTLVMCKIEAHEGAGVYQAQEVFWSGSAWATITGVSRQFGTIYSTPGLRQIAGDTGVAANTIVRAFLFCSQGTTDLGDWFFQEGGGGAYTGPFAVTYAGTTLTVGATRGGAVVDYIIVHPELLTKAAAETSAGVAAAGTLYYTIVRGFLTAGGGAASATLAYGTMPANTETTMYVPLATVTFAAGAITGARQLQYGNIIIDKTVDVFCP